MSSTNSSKLRQIHLNSRRPIKLAKAQTQNGISWNSSVKDLLGISLGIDSENKIQFIRKADGTQEKPKDFFSQEYLKWFARSPGSLLEMLFFACYELFNADFETMAADSKPKIGSLKDESKKQEFGKQLSEVFKDSQVIDLGCGIPAKLDTVRFLAELWNAKQYIGIDMKNSNRVIKDEFGINPKFQSLFLQADIEDFLSKCKSNEHKKVFILMCLEDFYQKPDNLKTIMDNLKKLMQPGDYIVCDGITDISFQFFENSDFKYLNSSEKELFRIYKLAD